MAKLSRKLALLEWEKCNIIRKTKFTEHKAGFAHLTNMQQHVSRIKKH